MSPELCRAGRQLLGWTRMDLAVAALVSRQTVINLEEGRHRPSDLTCSAISSAFRRAGLELRTAPGGDNVVKRTKKDSWPD
ncbi:helix-turn-helix transcriptional regulator [Pararoseomonas sp. SCSIO 73927]|uniref:helix-turn-helix transcriptional regulator n=1 Tax=Pararoseomonas sp. SCSIO 73927 TaxID=3114537 RepID=UPI0038D0F19E